jgi:hypothetical protein
MSETENTNLVRAIAGEDLAPGMFVATIYEARYISTRGECGFSPPSWSRQNFVPMDEYDAYEVVSVCLPFVLVKSASGSARVLDTRVSIFARLSDEFGRLAFEHMRPPAPS